MKASPPAPAGGDRQSGSDISKRRVSFAYGDGALMTQSFLDEGVRPRTALVAALARAEDRLSRLDERAGYSGLSEAWRGRADLRATLGALWLEGEVVHPEALILHDLGMDTETPERTVVRAAAILRARRNAERGQAALLSWRGVLWLLGRSPSPPAGPRPSLRVGPAWSDGDGLDAVEDYLVRLARGDSEEARAGVEECLAAFDLDGPEVTPLLAAAVFLDAWRLVDPLPAQRWLGSLLASLWLSSQRRFGVGLAPLEVGFRRRGSMPGAVAWGPPERRLVWWLEGAGLACDLELEEIVRLRAKAAQLERRTAGRRVRSKLPALGSLLLDKVAVSTPIIAEALRVTPQGARHLIGELGDIAQEITGRSRYQVWRL
jgi:hypothetical protein